MLKNTMLNIMRSSQAMKTESLSLQFLRQNLHSLKDCRVEPYVSLTFSSVALLYSGLYIMLNQIFMLRMSLSGLLSSYSCLSMPSRYYAQLGWEGYSLKEKLLIILWFLEMNEEKTPNASACRTVWQTKQIFWLSKSKVERSGVSENWAGICCLQGVRQIPWYGWQLLFSLTACRRLMTSALWKKEKLHWS